MRSARALAAGLLLGCSPSGAPRAPEAGPPVADVSATPDDVAIDGADEVGSSSAAPAPSSSPVSGAEPDEPAGSVDAPANPNPNPGPNPAPPAGAVDPEPPTPSDAAAPSPEPRASSAAAPLELPRPLHGDVDPRCGRDAGVGQPLKSFSLPGLGDAPVTHRTFRGRVQLVNFWGTWCKPCLKELPEFDQLYRRYRKFGMTLLAIATDEDAQTVKETVDKKKLGAKIAIAGEAYAGQYGSPKFPFTFVVDHKGVIRASYRGYKPECMGRLEDDIRQQLQVRAEAKARRGRK